MAAATLSNTTNCRICQRFRGSYEQRTGRARAVLSAFPSMRVPLCYSPFHSD